VAAGQEADEVRRRDDQFPLAPVHQAKLQGLCRVG
jgi:hypothetical protein